MTRPGGTFPQPRLACPAMQTQITDQIDRLLRTKAQDITQAERVLIATIGADIAFLLATEAAGGKVAQASLDSTHTAAGNVTPYAAQIINEAIETATDKLARRFMVPVGVV